MLSHLFEVEAILHILDATAKTPEDELDVVCNSSETAGLRSCRSSTWFGKQEAV